MLSHRQPLRIVLATLVVAVVSCSHAGHTHKGIANGVFVEGWRLFKNPSLSDVTGQLKRIKGNTLVITAKVSEGFLMLPLTTPSRYAINPIPPDGYLNFEQILSNLKSRKYRLIVYLVAFRDQLFAHAHPEVAVRTENGQLHEGPQWTYIDPASSLYQEYLLSIIDEVSQLAPVDEVMLDYIRYPEGEKLVFPSVVQPPERERVITAFVKRAAHIIRSNGKQISLSVFPPLNDNEFQRVQVGQNYVALAECVDVISPMIYPSLSRKVKNNTRWDRYFVDQIEIAENLTARTDAQFRPWVQGFYIFWDRTEEQEKKKAVSILPPYKMKWQIDYLERQQIPFLVYSPWGTYDFPTESK